jgi:hypothetical protein
MVSTPKKSFASSVLRRWYWALTILIAAVVWAGLALSRRGVGLAEALVFWPFAVCISKTCEISGAVATRATRQNDTIDREQTSDREPGRGTNIILATIPK